MIDSIAQYVDESDTYGLVYSSSMESACKTHENARLEVNNARQALTIAELQAISTGDELTASKSTYANWKKEHTHLFKVRLDLKKLATRFSAQNLVRSSTSRSRFHICAVLAIHGSCVCFEKPEYGARSCVRTRKTC